MTVILSLKRSLQALEKAEFAGLFGLQQERPRISGP
jgi:hypothetical protein